MDQKSAAKKELNGVLGMLTLMKGLLLLSWLLLYPFLMLITLLIYGTDDSQTVLTRLLSMDHPAGLLLEIAVTVFAVGIPIGLYLFLSGKKYSDVAEIRRPSAIQILYGVSATLVLGYASVYAGDFLLSLLFSAFGMQDVWEKMLLDESAYPMAQFPLLLLLIVVAVLPAFLEESAMRGIAVSCAKKYGTAFTVLFSGFFFSFLHGTVVQIPFTFVIGCVLAYFTLRYHTIWIAVISHFVFNLNSTITALIFEHSGEAGELFASVWLISVLSVALVVLILCIAKQGIRRPDLPRSAFKIGEKWRILLSSPFFYVFLILAFAQIALVVWNYSL